MIRLGLYLAVPPEGGGAFQYSLSMLEAVAALPKDRYDAVAVHSHPSWSAFLSKYPIRHDAVPMPKAWELAAYAWRKIGLPVAAWRAFASTMDPVARQLLAFGNDLWIYPAQDPMAYMLPAPALTTVHDLMHRYEARFPEVSGRQIREYHYRAACRYARGILVDSETGKRQLIESYGVPADRVHPLPYVPPSYMYATEEPPDVVERFTLPPKFFFYPAQFWTHKNHLRLLDAMARLTPEHPDIRFVFVGARKNGYEEIVNAIGRLGLADRVQILDYVPHVYMPAIYRRARALVMPTFFGPTNIPPLEAMVVGCPVAISGTYGMPEQSADAAIYFEPSSTTEIASAMARLWTDDELCRRLAATGRARIGQFSQAAFSLRLARILDSVCARA